MDFDVASRFEQVRGIVHIDFGEQGPRSVVNGSRTSDDGSLESPAGEFGENQIRVQPRPDLRGIELRDIDIDAQRVQGRDVKQFARGSAAAAGIDQLADVGIARRDHAVKGRVHFLEGLHVLQPLHIGLGRFDGGPAGIVISRGIVDVLLRDRIRFQQFLVARGRDFREAHVGLGRGEVRARLLQLLIHFRRIDFGEQLSRFHIRADIGVPLFQVTVGPRKNGGIRVRLHVAGDDNFLLRSAQLGVNDGDRGNRKVARLLGELRIGLAAAGNSPDDDQGDDNHDEQEHYRAGHLAARRR